MFDQGDGGWAAVDLKTPKGESRIFGEYMQPNAPKQCLQWKGVQVDLGPYANSSAELILRCFNDAGKQTIADWLNWRDIILRSPQQTESTKEKL
jgi:hypothetical protein